MPVICPHCGTEMTPFTDMPAPDWYICPNATCRCSDGQFSLHLKPRPLKWIEDQHRKNALKESG